MQTIPQNAERYYKKAKEMAKKSAGAKAALQATMKIAGAKAEAKKSRGAYRRKKPKWYERFRWFHSSDGFLVIGGRDVDSNEEIYAKYLEKRDLAMHTDAPGAPLTVIKTGGEEVPESTLLEAAIFAVSNSSLWKARVASGDCYMVKGDQVTKTPEHGEFLRKGSFVIRGERRYWRDVPLGLAIALVGDSLIGGPVSAVRAACNAKSRSQAEWPEDGELEAGEADHEKIDVMEIEPGEYNADDLGKRIYRFLAEKVDDRHFLKAVASVEQIVSFLPPGGSRLKQSVGVKDEEQE
jgi:hypothetical protein